MRRRYNLAHLILAGVVVLGLTPLMVVVDAQTQAQIAFSSNRNGNQEIYVMDADGGNLRKLTNDLFFNNWDPSWSPDGKRIVFVSERDGNSEIYVINAGGAWQPRRLTNNLHDDTAPAWYDPAFAVAPASKTLTMWGWLKQVHR